MQIPLTPAAAASEPRQNAVHLSSARLRAALDVLHVIGQASLGIDEFARRGVACLPRLVRSELTTLSVCNLESGHRSVVSDQPKAISRRAIDVFDHYFHGHPLVREHGGNARAVTMRIGDLLPVAAFQRTPLYNEYYRPIGIDHVMAVPIHVDRRLLVSFVFNRSKRDFSDRDRAILEVIRPHLGDLYRLAARASAGSSAPPLQAPDLPSGARLTERELDVLQWLATGKTDRDIGDLLGISRRTVHKHLQRIYEKLGVETRTAAVMRVLATRHAS